MQQHRSGAKIHLGLHSQLQNREEKDALIFKMLQDKPVLIPLDPC